MLMLLMSMLCAGVATDADAPAADATDGAAEMMFMQIDAV